VLAMVTVRLIVGLVIRNTSLEELTGTISWLVFHHIRARSVAARTEDPT
jgi:hypothetical protein